MLLLQILKPIIKKIKSSRFLSFIARYVIYGLVRLLFLTYRLEASYHPSFRLPVNEAQGVFYFWHQNILSGMFFFFKTKSVGHCIISPSNDGRIAGFVCQRIGFNVLYGSSHKASIALVRQSIAALRQNKRLCLVGDGSRGPAFKLQPGISYLAEKSNLPVFFVDCTPSWAFTFKKSWDQFKIPLPFSKIIVRVHEPVMHHRDNGTE